MTRVGFWFDPSCSFSWVTSRWMVEVERVRDIRIEWHVMSLAVLNAGRDGLSEKYLAYLETTWAPVRVLVAAEQQHGGEVVLPLYTAMSGRFYVDKMPRDLATITDALVDVGLPVSLLAAVHDETLDDAVRLSHDAAMDLVGDEVGTPTVGIGGFGFFGPVLTKAPRGEQAGRLWDAAVAFASYPHFHELKRSRDRDLEFD